MKSSIVNVLLALSLTAAYALPRTQTQIEVKSIAPRVSFEELVQIAYMTLVGIGEAMDKADKSFEVLMRGSPQQTTVMTIIKSTEDTCVAIMEKAMVEGLEGPEEDLQPVIERALERLAPIVISAVADIRKAIENESAELKEAAEVILLTFTEELMQAVKPLIEAIGGEGGSGRKQ